MSEDEDTGTILPNLGGQPPQKLDSSEHSLRNSRSVGPILSDSLTKSGSTHNLIVDEKYIKTEKKTKANIFELTRKWKVVQRRIQRSLQTMMSYEFKTKVSITVINQLHRDLIGQMFQGQIEFLKSKINEIKKGNDPLSKELMKSDSQGKASTQVFYTLIEIIEEELQRFKVEKPDISEPLVETFKLHRDARTEPRMCLWIIISTGLQLKLIRQKVPEAFDIVFDVMVRYRPAIKRALALFLLFCYHFINELDPYPFEICNTRLIVGPTKTGYNMASWIKYRYGTNSQAYMEYERFVDYFLRGFGRIPSNSPKGGNSPRNVYQNWLVRTFDKLEESLRKSTLMLEFARGNSLEGMIVGLIDEIKDELIKREYDVDGKLMNYPQGGENAIDLLNWIFESAFNKYKTTNIAAHGQVRLRLDMFDFVESSIRWVNEYGERIVMDWLEESEDPEDLGELSDQPDFTH